MVVYERCSFTKSGREERVDCYLDIIWIVTVSWLLFGSSRNEETLRDNPNNGCVGDFAWYKKQCWLALIKKMSRRISEPINYFLEFSLKYFLSRENLMSNILIIFFYVFELKTYFPKTPTVCLPICSPVPFPWVLYLENLIDTCITLRKLQGGKGYPRNNSIMSVNGHPFEWHGVGACQTLLSEVLVAYPRSFVINEGLVLGWQSRIYLKHKVFVCLFVCRLLFSVIIFKY